MVRTNTQINVTESTHLGGGYLSNRTITLRKNKHERILESPSF